MNLANDPVDIIWENMGGIRGVYFSSVIWNIIGLLAIIFISTPAVLISRIKQLTYIDHVDFDFADKIPFSGIIG